VASAEVAVVAVHGPYATYDYHADVERGDTGPRSAARHGVVDWRTGRPAPLATLFGADVARAIAPRGGAASRPRATRSAARPTRARPRPAPPSPPSASTSRASPSPRWTAAPP
jgi:hypothetical protein